MIERIIERMKNPFARKPRPETEEEYKQRLNAWFQYHPSKKINAGSEYETFYPIAMYSPWNMEPNFLALLKCVDPEGGPPQTLVDKYRLWELYWLAQQTALLEEGDYLEIGVWRGGSSLVVAKAFQLTNQKNVIYLADTFEGVPNAGERDQHYKGGEHSETSRERVEDLLLQNGIRNYKILKGIFPEKTAHLIPSSAKFRMVHIDVDVYQSAKESFEYVWPNMVRGGIVAFDDYGFMGCNGVTTAVDELKATVKDGLFIYNINGHAIVVKR